MGAAAAVEPQAADHPRRELRNRPPVRHGAERHRRHRGARRQPDHRARPRLRRDVDGARQRRAQLQPAHRGRVADHGQGAPDRVLRRASATRSARAARVARWCSSRWPTPIRASTRGSCRSAASRTPGRPGSSSWTTTSIAPTSRTRPSGARGSRGRRRRSRPWRVTPTTSTRSSSTRSTSQRSAIPPTPAPA